MAGFKKGITSRGNAARKNNMNKTWNIIYFITTILISAAFLFGGYSELAGLESGKQLFVHLGYPMYLLYILGVAKILGVIGIWQKFSPALREWAYAGIVINLLGAISSHIFVGDGFGAYGPATGMLVVALLSYTAMKKRVGVSMGQVV